MAVSRPTAKMDVLIEGFEDDNLRIVAVHSIDQVVGHGDVNKAKFELVKLESIEKPQVLNSGVQDLFHNLPCRIIIHNRHDEEITVHWGKIVSASVDINANSETIVLESRLDHHLMGDWLDRQYCAVRKIDAPSTSGPEGYDTTLNINALSGPRVIEEETIFNPIFEDVAVPNRFKNLVSGLGDQSYVFVNPVGIHPETLEHDRKIGAGLAQGEPTVALFWTLRDAVQYLCWHMNATQTYVFNPTIQELAAVLPDDPSLLRHVVIRPGRLPECLSQLLEPLGYDQFIAFTSGKPKLVVFRRGGTGKPIDLPLQAPGETVDDDLSIVHAMSVDFDITEKSANVVEVVGGYYQVEGTFELVPGWPPEWDKLDADDPDSLFTAGGESWSENDDQRNAWRKWVLNESGDMTGIRPWITKAFDVERFFLDVAHVDDPDPTIPIQFELKRRHFEPTLSLNKDGTTRGDSGNGILVEWYNGTAWINVRGVTEKDLIDNEGLDLEVGAGTIAGGSVHVLKNECGIYFSNLEKFPEEIYDAAREAGTVEGIRIRVTATLTGDARLRAIRKARISLLNDRRHVRVEVGGDYQVRNIARGDVDNASILADAVDNGDLLAAEVDDRATIGKLAGELIRNWSHGSMDGQISVDGIDHDFEEWRGRPLQKIAGREFRFELNHLNDLPNLRFPTVTRVSYLPQEQLIKLRFGDLRGRTS